MIKIEFNNKNFTWHIDEADLVWPDSTIKEMQDLADELGKIKLEINLFLKQLEE